MVRDSPRVLCNIFLLLYPGVAGGLTNLSKMPACNILVLGAQKKTLSGFSTTAIMPHTGFIHFCDIVQKTNPVSKINIRYMVQLVDWVNGNTCKYYTEIISMSELKIAS